MCVFTSSPFTNNIFEVWWKHIRILHPETETATFQEGVCQAQSGLLGFPPHQLQEYKLGFPPEAPQRLVLQVQGYEKPRADQPSGHTRDQRHRPDGPVHQGASQRRAGDLQSLSNHRSVGGSQVHPQARAGGLGTGSSSASLRFPAVDQRS